MKTKKGLDYGVSFDKLDMPGKIRAVRVQLDTVIMGPDSRIRVDLCDHPLYPKLEQYVLANPSRGKPGVSH